MKRTSVKNETKLVCPKCGAEFAIAEYEHISIGIAIGKDSGLGTVSPALADESESKRNKLKNMSSEAKIAALRNAGLDVSNFFSMRGATGVESVVTQEHGSLRIVTDEDPIYDIILNEGTVPNPTLYRRWVMSQMFHMLSYRSPNGKAGFVAALDAKGYKYQWKMTLEEMRVQARLFEKDPENYELRNHWFNNKIVAAMCFDYLCKLREHVGRLKTRHCKGIPYVKFSKCNIFVSDLETKVYEPLSNLADNISQSDSPTKIFKYTRKFVDFIQSIWLDNETPMDRFFKDAYKGAGAYFTMQNLILFHGARFKSNHGFWSQADSLKSLDFQNQKCHGEGWRLLGVMKRLITDSNINIEKKMEEWRK